jgi:hypothetical protein
LDLRDWDSPPSFGAAERRAAHSDLFRCRQRAQDPEGSSLPIDTIDSSNRLAAIAAYTYLRLQHGFR